MDSSEHGVSWAVILLCEVTAHTLVSLATPRIVFSDVTFFSPSTRVALYDLVEHRTSVPHCWLMIRFAPQVESRLRNLRGRGNTLGLNDSVNRVVSIPLDFMYTMKSSAAHKCCTRILF